MRDPLTRVGALLDAGALQPSRTARNHLLWLAHSQGLGARRVDEVLALAGLQTAARRKAGGYSLGMRQRLGIAAALLGDPPVLMFDEPFNGMDPEGIVWMRGFLASLAAEGRAVLVSSDLTSELQDNASHVVIVGRGKVIADASVAELLASASGDRVMLRTEASTQAATVLANAGAEVDVTGPDRLSIAGLPAERAVVLLSGHAIPFFEVTAHRATLEEAYLELTKDAVEFQSKLRRPHDHGHALPADGTSGPRRLRASAACRVDQVQDGPRLGHLRHRRDAADHAARPVHLARGSQCALLHRPG